MNTNIICFSKNRPVVELAFRDYMNQYLSETQGKTDYIYDKNVSFAEKEKKIDKLVLEEVFQMSDISNVNNLSIEARATNPTFRWAYFTVINNLIDMVIPEIINKSMGLYTETYTGDYGNNWNFEIEPNQLFYVSKAGRDQRTVEFNKQYTGQVTITPENRAISVSVDFFRVLCGKESIAKFVMKAVLSLEAQITRDVYVAFDKAMGEIPTTPVDTKLHLTGWNEKEAIRVAQTVTAWNAGSKAVFVGTQVALSDILPTNANYRYWLDSEYVTLGYVRDFKGFSTMVLDQVADYKTPNKLFMNDKRIYVYSPASQKPIKLVYEGGSRTNSMDFLDSANLTASTTINKSYGIGIGTNAISGSITLA